MKWEDKVLEYLRERQDQRRGRENTGMEHLDKTKWRFAVVTPLSELLGTGRRVDYIGLHYLGHNNR